MAKYQLTNPSNARIFIDFKDKKHLVRFSYPNKHSAFKICFATFTIVWVLLLMIFGLGNILIFAVYGLFQPTPEQTEIHSNQLYLLPPLMVYGTSGFIFTIGMPFLFTAWFVSSEKRLKLMPKINYKLQFLFGDDKRRVIVKNLKSRVWQLNIFSNVQLEYKCTKDFSKYLSKIEVLEHDFWFLERGRFSNKYTKAKNEYEWYARFYFSKIPKEGHMIVDYV